MPATSDVRERILEAAADLVFDRGYSAMTVDAVLEATGASKGAFFHHFASKAALGKAVLERYALTDAEVLEEYMSKAESMTSDPARQLIEFIRGFEVAVEEGRITQPGCMFASFAYEKIPEEAAADEVILRAIALWRDRIAAKLREAVAARPLALPVEVETLADHVWTVFEGAFLLARATKDQMKIRDQLAQLRVYLTLQLLPAGDARM